MQDILYYVDSSTMVGNGTIISYGTSSEITHFSKATRLTIVVAKWGQLERFTHDTRNCYPAVNSGTDQWGTYKTNYTMGVSIKKYGMLMIALIIFSSSLFFVNMHRVDANDIGAKLDKNIKNLMLQLKSDALENPQLSASSNPYDYINNDCYDNIVALGPKALPFLKAKIQNSNQDGLPEYIMAIAAEEIAKVDLKSKYGWASAKGWVDKWNKHLKSVKNDVNTITDTVHSPEEMNEKLVELGIPAIPYIIDKIEKGNDKIIPALERLLADNTEVILTKEQSKDINRWIKNNKDSFDYIRNMVEAE